MVPRDRGGLILDIDLDFLFGPTRVGSDNPETFEMWMTPECLLRELFRRGIPDVHGLLVVGDHKYAYHKWALDGYRGARVVHLDAHSDAYSSMPELLHCGNFLLRAINDGIVDRVDWVVPDWMFKPLSDEEVAEPMYRAYSICEAYSRLIENGSSRRGFFMNPQYVDLPISLTRLGDLSMDPSDPIDLITIATSRTFVPASAIRSVLPGLISELHILTGVVFQGPMILR